jgi:hypothetical protein
MDFEEWTTDRLEQELLAEEGERSRLAAKDMAILEVLDSRQVATGDGCRSLSEWTASSLDVGLDTARTLVRTMRRTQDRPDLREALASGDLSFDRVEALSRIPEDIGFWEHTDIAGMRREAARRARIGSETGYRTAEDRFLVLQPSLDESWWKLFGGLDGACGAMVDKVLTILADDLPPLPDGTRGDSSWRKATALVELAVSDDPPPAQVSIFVDTDQAVGSNGQAGITLETGPRVGRDALEAILCDAITEITGIDTDGTPLRYGRQSRTIPPALRRAIIHRDGNRCAADGCDSRNRLQVHHIIPWSQDGPTDPDNLITLCWYHHQIVIHEQGFHIHRHPDHGRIRFHKPGPRDPPG